MKSFINNVRIAGTLVKHTLEETTYTKNGDDVECIRGEVIVRTADGGEHEVKYFANKYKKDANGQFTSEESKIYKSLQTVMAEYKTLENCPDDPDYVAIKSASFGVNDYISSNTNELVTINTVSSNFIERVITKEKIEATPATATFEVEGVIASIADEIIKNEPTGNLVVTMNVITQKRIGTGKDAKYEVNDIFPLKLIVASDLAEAFRTSFGEGSFAKLSGVLVNKTETVTTTEKQVFGDDLVKTFTNTIRRNEITSGSAPQSIYEVDLTDDICSQLISKRNAKIAEIKNGNKSSGTTSAASSTSSRSTNPFAKKNPFAK